MCMLIKLFMQEGKEKPVSTIEKKIGMYYVMMGWNGMG